MAWKALAAIAVVALITLTPAAAQLVGAETYYRYARFTRLKVPAVYVDEHGAMHGVISTLEVGIAWPGRGVVYLSVEPLSMIDMQAAARVAALVAATYAGVNFSSYDYFIRIESNSTTIGGPSAGAAMTVALLSLLTNATVRGDVSMTGMIEPDGTIGPVGGIPEKLRAAASAGAKLFLVPKGQLVVRETREVVENRTAGGVTIVTRRVVPVEVNLTELGRELGVEVRDVGSVIEAYRYLTGGELPIHRHPLTYTPDIARELSRIYSDIVKAAESNLSSVEGVEESLPKELRGKVQVARESLERAREYLSRGKYYSAASEAFQAAITSTYASIVADFIAEYGVNREKAIRDLQASVNAYLSRARELVNYVAKELEGFESRNTFLDTQLQLAVASYIRAMEANRTIKLAEETPILPLRPEGSDALSYAIYSYWRAMSAKEFMDIASRVSRGQELSKAFLGRGVVTLSSFALITRLYLETLIGAQVGGVGVEDVRRLVSEGRVIEAAATAVNSLSTGVALMHEALGTSGELAPYAKAGAEALGSRLVDAGFTVLLPAFYLERAELVNTSRDVIVLCEMAASYSLLLMYSALQVGVSKPVATQPVTTVTKTVTVTETVTRTSGGGAEVTVTATKTVTVTATPKNPAFRGGPPGPELIAVVIVASAIGAVVGYAASRKSSEHL